MGPSSSSLRLIGATVGALGIAAIGYWAFVASIHDPTAFHSAIELICLPFFRVGTHAGFFWIPLGASVALWAFVLFKLTSIFSTRLLR